jgi:hypothetical protein
MGASVSSALIRVSGNHIGFDCSAKKYGILADHVLCPDGFKRVTRLTDNIWIVTIETPSAWHIEVS